MTIDFPDGHARVLKMVQLVVDGQVVATQANTTTVTALVWPLASYATNAPHQLQARVVDELGLAAESQVATVSVSLQVPAAARRCPRRWQRLPTAIGRCWPWPPAGCSWPCWWAAAPGSSTRAASPCPSRCPPGRALAWPPRRRPLCRPAPPTRPLICPKAPLSRWGRPTGPVQRARHAAGWRAESRRIGRRSLPHVALPAWRWPGRHAHGGPRAAAFLQVVEPGGGGAPVPNIELLSPALSLGRDGAVAETVFHDRSVSRLHARIVSEDGEYRIFDSGSTSGTWVNYTPVPPDMGQLLQDGDLINLGRVQLRFQCRDHASPSGNGAHVAVVAVASPLAPAPLAEPPAVEQPREHSS